MVFLVLLINLTGMIFNVDDSTAGKASVSIDVSQKIHTMGGGLGASWHAISKEIPLNTEGYAYLPEGNTPRGSAYGGNPPVSDIMAWQQVSGHASWLGLNFIRVEMSQRMYEPQRRQFDWDNEEMQALYNILDWCQHNNADVLLQQMWRYVEWNAIPEVHPLISAPRDLGDFVYSVGTLMDYLIKDRGYTCIKYFGMTNEPPGGTWGSWWEYGKQEGSINDAWREIHREFANRGIQVKLSGPGWTDMPPFIEEKLVFAPYMQSIDIHSYGGVTPAGEENLRKWANWAHRQNKPFFLTEFGNMNLGWRFDNPGPKTFNAALSNAGDLIRGLRAGVDGFNRWSFTNRGDLDGQWQLLQTWDRDKKEYFREVKPEQVAYYGFAILSRFISKYSATVVCHVNQPDSVLMATALLSPAGELSVFLVNNSNKPLQVELDVAAYPTRKLFTYQVSEGILEDPEFLLEPARELSSSDIASLILPARSITTVSSYRLYAGDDGIIVR
jgi:hypothetical protein